MKSTTLLSSFFLLATSLGFGATATTSISGLQSGLTASVTTDGQYVVTTTLAASSWSFGGSVPKPLTGITTARASDSVGTYSELRFQYVEGTRRQASIRLYDHKPIVLFGVQFPDGSANAAPFPNLTNYPHNLSELGFNGTFGVYRYQSYEGDSPWVMFDDSAHALILSPAANFLVAQMKNSAQGWTSGIQSSVTQLPSNFQHATILVVENGINRAYETWGHAMTDLQNKTRPAQDADIILQKLGYWTDAGAGYYYHFEDPLGYEGTLLQVRDEFTQKGIPMGYLQLDSWFYPKGPNAVWDVNTGAGMWLYVAEPKLFPDGLDGFQKNLATPLVTHARWVDPSSPLRQTFQTSGNVVIDPNYWNQTAQYLQQSGVTVFEQDWLSQTAQPVYNLTDPVAFFDNMAKSMAARNITIQYCMPLPRHFLQSTHYNNVTTIRPSEDRFERKKWDMFLYGSRLASSLGLWPWVDVFMSTETENLLIANLSAGPVGVGDRIGKINAANLNKTIRSDGTIVKPDVPLTPTDESYLNEAKDPTQPMVAATHSDFGLGRALYVFAYTRGGSNAVSFNPASLGTSGPAYVYNVTAGTGQAILEGQTVQDQLATDHAYYIVAPQGPSKIAFLGDIGQYVSLGKQRIVSVEDHGQLKVKVAFAPNEGPRTLFGYSPESPVITLSRGKLGAVSHDRQTGRFKAEINPQGASSIDLTMSSPVGGQQLSKPQPQPGVRSGH